MSTLYAQAAGNASAIAYKVDGVGDDVAWGDIPETDGIETNNFTVNLDPASFTRAALTNALGGKFTVDLNAVGAREFTCDGTAVAAVTGGLLDVSGTTYPLTINGDWIGGPSNGSYLGRITSACSVTWNGSITGGTNANTCLYLTGAATIAFNGRVAGGDNSNAAGIWAAAGNLNFNYELASNTNGSPGLYIAHTGVTAIVNGVYDLTTGALPVRQSIVGTTQFRLSRRAKCKMLGPDGTTPIYFRPEAAQHFGGLVGRTL